jgi:hypothetical protein
MWVLMGVLLITACKSGSDKMKERQKQHDAERKSYEAAEEAKRKASEPKIDWAVLDEAWNPKGSAVITSGKPCPDGLWTLFPVTPGEGDEQQANEAKRASLLEKVMAQTYVVQLRHGQGVALRKYNAKKKTLTVEVEGLVECFDGAGLLSVAWGEPAKPFRPKAEDEEDGATPQSVWRAQPLLFPLPFSTPNEAKAFAEQEGIGTIARLVFTLGKSDVDKKLKKTAKPNGEEGEDVLDWGAGRLIHVKLSGVRLSTDHEKKLLSEKRM